MKRNLDLRVVKTKKNIKKVFLELMEEKGFAKLNVQNLVERAEINRSTFYLHYVDKFDLLNKLEDDLLAGIRNIALDIPVNVIASRGFEDERVFSGMLRIAQYIQENRRIFTLLMSENGDPAFTSKLGKFIKSVWYEKKVLDMLTIPQQYALAAVVGIMSSLISEWLKSGLRETPEDYMRIVTNIIKDVPKNLLDQNALPDHGA